MLHHKSKIPAAVLILLTALFAFSLFKNISYPLLWNDEAETTMFAERILDYGYPKIHDGKNVLYMMEIPFKFGARQGIDAYVGNAWGQYYFAAIGAALAKKAADIYSKTSLLRIPFAAIGFLGIFVMALSVITVFKKKSARRAAFLAAFIFFELLSVPLALHLREVRYYSLLIFLSACVFYIYINYRFIKKISAAVYIWSLTLLLALLFNTFALAYFAFFVAIGLFECVKFLKKKNKKVFLTNLSPLFLSAVPIIPLLAFYKTLLISSEYAKFLRVSPVTYINNLAVILNFFKKFEFLYLALAVKSALAGLWFYLQKQGMPYQLRKSAQKADISNFFSLFFISYALIAAKMPIWHVYERYYIILQPVLTLILLADIFIILELLNSYFAKKRQTAVVLLSLISAIFILNGLNKIDPIRNHVYELFHQYKGPLDFVIPYIKSNYKDTSQLTIATNYEECAYMYYLESKTVMGYVGNNLEQDLKTSPDIIIFRKRGDLFSLRLFNTFLQKERYAMGSFRVYDYPFNNIPEENIGPPHLFKTRLAQNAGERLDIYFKTE